MGGYGSNRWGSTHVRATTGDSFCLPIASLKPYFTGGPWTMGWQWKRGDEITAKIGLYVSRGYIALDYTTTRGDNEPRAVHDAVPIAWTGCNYGGERAWFVCPDCEIRRNALYLSPGQTRFRCRACHNLAYATQQMDPHDRHLQHIRALQEQLDGGGGEYVPWSVPPKPKGMRWETYQRLHRAILIHEVERNTMLQARFEVHQARWVKQGLLPI